MPKNKYDGFTIVEILVVIVVIGILASLTIVAYTGLSQKAAVASLQSDLDNASKQLKLDQVINSGYPTTLVSANNGKGIAASPNTTYNQYIYNNNANPQVFCITATNTPNNTSYKITNDTSPILGTCQTPGIVTDGLVLNLDAGNTVSYPSPFNSTAWTDLSVLGNHSILVNGVGYSSSNGGTLSFDGVNDYTLIGNQSIVGSGVSPVTGQLWIYNTKNWSSGQYTMPVRVKQDSEFFLSMYNPSGTLYVYPTFRGYTQWGTPVIQSDFVNKWVLITFIYNGGDKNIASSYAVYVNGVKIPTGTNNYGAAGGGGSNCNIIGSDGNSGCNSTGGGMHQGKIGSYSLYSRVLSDSEILQNFNALRERYGI